MEAGEGGAATEISRGGGSVLKNRGDLTMQTVSLRADSGYYESVSREKTRDSKTRQESGS
jgi:hypothetical protein